jgi:hypothetical protein
MTSEIFKVNASFRKQNGEPLTGKQYMVGLRDKDRFFDDKLGKSSLDANGNAEFLVFASDIVSFDSPSERAPDLYFIVERDGEEIYRSVVFPNVDFDAVDEVTGRARSLTRSFGPFTVLE